MNPVSDPLPSIPQRVEKGRVWLEEQGAYDWAERIVAAVDESRFQMMSGCNCAVGVTLGHYETEFFDLQEGTFTEVLTLAAQMGFAVGPGTRWEDEIPTFRALEAEWERAAREHASYRAEVLGQ